MEDSLTVSLAFYAIAVLKLSQPISPPSIYKFARDLLKVYIFPTITPFPLFTDIYKTPTRTIRTCEQLVNADPVNLVRTSDHVYFCALSILCFSVGVRLLLCRATKGVFFSSGFMIYVGCMTKVCQTVAAISGTHYTYSALATAFLRLVLEFNSQDSPTLTNSVHNLIMITESSLASPLDTLLVVATVLSCSLCSAIADMIFPHRVIYIFSSFVARLYLIISSITYPVFWMFLSVYSSSLIEFLSPPDSLLFSADILTFWATSGPCDSNIASGLVAIAFSAAIESLMIYSTQRQPSFPLFYTYDMDDFSRDTTGTLWLATPSIFDLTGDFQGMSLGVPKFETYIEDTCTDAVDVSVDTGNVQCDLTTEVFGSDESTPPCLDAEPQQPHVDPQAHITSDDECSLCDRSVVEPSCPLIESIPDVEDSDPAVLHIEEVDDSPRDINLSTVDTSSDIGQIITCAPIPAPMSCLNDVVPPNSTTDPTDHDSYSEDKPAFDPIVDAEASATAPTDSEENFIEEVENVIYFPSLVESPGRIRQISTAMDIKIREMENIYRAIDESIERAEEQAVTSPPPPVTSNPPAGKPYIRVPVHRPPRLRHQKRQPCMALV